jgi:uncharacterized protein YaiI (UPF0178 family)
MPTDAIVVFIDADACPVKDEVYRVAGRYGLKTYVVANGGMRVPDSPLVERVTVEAGPDAADDWIVARIAPGAIAITADILLARRVLEAGAHALAPNGRPFTDQSIGAAVAQRALMEQLRATGEITGGPRPFARSDRSRFHQAHDANVQKERRPRDGHGLHAMVVLRSRSGRQ